MTIRTRDDFDNAIRHIRDFATKVLATGDLPTEDALALLDGLVTECGVWRSQTNVNVFPYPGPRLMDVRAHRARAQLKLIDGGGA